MGLNFAAVLGHELEADRLWELPQVLGAARAPHLTHAIAEFDRRTNEYMMARYQIPPRFPNVAEQAWNVSPTQLPLYRDATGALTLVEPPAMHEELGKRGQQIHFAPVDAWRTVGMAEWWALEKPLEADGPAGLMLTIGPHALDISCWLRWGIFLTEPTLLSALRYVCYELSRVVGSPLAIYTSDTRTPIDAIAEGSTIVEIVAQLRASLDTLRPILSVLDKDSALDNSDHDAYYLDTFADL